MRRSKLETSLRWTARIGSAGSLLFILIFVVAHLLEPAAAVPTGGEWLGLALFPTGVAVGLLLAWWKEMLGGGLCVFSVIGFYAWHVARTGDLPSGSSVLLLAVPGLLSLLTALLRKTAHRRTAAQVERTADL